MGLSPLSYSTATAADIGFTGSPIAVISVAVGWTRDERRRPMTEAEEIDRNPPKY
jgi:hypothetical protein